MRNPSVSANSAHIRWSQNGRSAQINWQHAQIKWSVLDIEGVCSQSVIPGCLVWVYPNKASAWDTFPASIGLLAAFWDAGIPASWPYWSKNRGEISDTVRRRSSIARPSHRLWVQSQPLCAGGPVPSQLMCVGNRPLLRVGPFTIARRYSYASLPWPCASDRNVSVWKI